MKLSNIILCIAVFLFGFFSSETYSQDLDTTSENQNNYVVAILTFLPTTQSVYYDTTSYIANQLSDMLRRIPNVQTLNVSSSSRYLKDGTIIKQYNYLMDTLSVSDNPDPENLTKIAQKLGANKIIIVSSFFDTQKDLLTKGVSSHFNIFDRRKIRPRFDYTVYIKMYDPSSGILEWSQTYNTSFNLDNFYLTTQKMSDNPMFQQEFNKFSVNVSNQSFLSFQNYLYGSQIVTVTGQILADKNNNQATEGVMTTDGRPYMPYNSQSANLINIPYPEQNLNPSPNKVIEQGNNSNPNNKISKPSPKGNLTKIKTEYQAQVLDEYKKIMVDRY